MPSEPDFLAVEYHENRKSGFQRGIRDFHFLRSCYKRAKVRLNVLNGERNHIIKECIFIDNTFLSFSLAAHCFSSMYPCIVFRNISHISTINCNSNKCHVPRFRLNPSESKNQSKPWPESTVTSHNQTLKSLFD
jgi:hypothetical protein